MIACFPFCTFAGSAPAVRSKMPAHTNISTANEAIIAIRKLMIVVMSRGKLSMQVALAGKGLGHRGLGRVIVAAAATVAIPKNAAKESKKMAALFFIIW